MKKKKLPLEAHSFIEQIYKHSPDVIYTLSKTGKFTSLSPSFEAITGWKAKDWLGKRFHPLVHRRDLPKAILSFTKALRNKKVSPFEIRVKKPDKSYLIGKIHVSTLVENRKVVGVLGIGKDLTEWRAKERKYQLSQRQLEVIFQNVADAVTVQEGTGKLLMVNEAAAKSSGYESPEKMLQDPMRWLRRFEIYDKDMRPFDIQNLPGRQALRGEYPEPCEICFVNKETGEKRWSLVNSRPVIDQDGKVEMAVNIIHDYTDRYLLEEQKDKFISMASTS